MKLEIPSWWTSATLNELITHAIGGDWGSAPETDDDKLTPVSCIRCTEIRNWDIEHGATAALRKIKKSSLENRRLQEGDILLEVSGGGPEQPVGRTILVDRQCLSFRKDLPKVPTNFLRLLRPATELEPRFLNRYLRFFYDSGEITNYQGGSNNLRNLKFQDYISISIPLPPLSEQKRIVAKIEELFSELEAGEASLRKARRQLGVYRQSLLKQAFEGKLTAKWRTQNPDRVSSWVSTTVGKIGRIETGTTPPTENQKNYGGDLPFFKPTDLEQGRQVKIARSHLSGTGQHSARVLPEGSVLVTCIGATIGKTGLAQLACATNQQINSISPAEDLLPEFVYFQVISPPFQEQIKTNASSTTLPILNKSKFSALPFERCSLPEQQEIVRLLDAQFEAIERNERELDAALQRSEALRQSILKKAFSGRLVPQDPADEPATQLLARLRSERAAAPTTKRKSALS